MWIMLISPLKTGDMLVLYVDNDVDNLSDAAKKCNVIPVKKLNLPKIKGLGQNKRHKEKKA